MNTLHRRDIPAADFRLLAGFCHAVKTLEDHNGHLPNVLGKVEMWLPTWYKSGSQWRLSRHQPFTREAYGFEGAAMRRICRYLDVREAQIVQMLYRFSMIAVVPRQRVTEPLRFRMPFTGIPIDLEFFAPPCKNFGFVIERRRAEGKF